MAGNTTTQVTLLLKARDDSKAAVDSFVHGMETMKSSIAGISTLAMGNMLGNLGADAFRGAVDGLKDFAGGMIDANSQIQLMQQRLNILYQSTTEGAQAFQFLKQNELTKPFNIQDILSASVSLVAFKQNIVTLLPALENIAGAMGRSLPDAAQAFNAALAGRFQMLRYMGISRQMLIDAGAKINSAGHLTDPSSLATAIENLGNTQFKDGAAKLSQTWTGLMSSMESQWTYFQAAVGQGVFTQLKTQLHDLVSYLQNNRAAVAQFESGIAQTLGAMAKGFIEVARIMLTDLPPAINFVRNAFAAIEPPVATAFKVISATIGNFVSWFRGTILPAIEIGIGTVSQWWQQHANDIARDFTFIVNTARNFAGTVTSVISGAWNAISDLTRTLWDGLKLSFTLGFDLLTGNFGAFKTDFLAGVKGLAADVVRGFGDMITGSVDVVTNLGIDLVTAMVPIANKMMAPMTWFAQTFRDLFKDLGTFIGGFANQFLSVMSRLMSNVDNVLNKVVDSWNAVADKSFGRMPKMGKVDMSDPIKSAGGNIDQQITGWFDTHAPGLNAGQRYTGISVAQAQKDLQANAKKITEPFNAFMNNLIDNMIGVVDPKGKNGAATQQAAQTAGQNLLSGIWDGIFGSNGIIGGLTKSTTAGTLGNYLSQPSAAASAYNLAVSGAFTNPVAAASAAASGPTVGTNRIPTGRVPLGALGAQFMQTVATTSQLHAGTDPATRAAQQRVTQGDRQISQGDLQTKLMQDTNTLLKDSARALDDMRGYLARLVGPQPHSTSLQARGVGRPVGI